MDKPKGIIKTIKLANRTKSFTSKCVICNNEIKGIYYTFPIGYCCENCYLSNPRCFHCGLPANKYSPYIFQDDDFILCQKCNKNKIVQKDDLKKLHYKMKFYAKEALGIYIYIKKVMLISSEELKYKTKGISYGTGRTTGYCQSSWQYSSINDVKVTNDIYLQNGMPYNMLFGTLAHEYGHAWEYQNKRSDLLIYRQDNIIFCEGFAQWVSYHTLRQYNLKEQANKIITNYKDDPIYGDGLKKMLNLEKKLGSKQAVLEYVKNNCDF